ncbi:MAG: hypothetical protein AAF513_04075 [Pseudomonadota bacterium]
MGETPSIGLGRSRSVIRGVATRVARLIALLVLILQGGAAQAPTSEAEENGVALARFAATTAFLHSHPQQEEQLSALQEACEGTSARRCLPYILNNRLAVLQALPDNPAYWQAYRAVLADDAYNPLPCLMRAQNPNECDRFSELHKIMGATQQWIWYQLAKQGAVSASDFVAIYDHISRHNRQSPTLTNKMIDVAQLGTLHANINMLMALAGAREDVARIQTLRGALRPFDQQARSIRAALDGERRYVSAAINHARSQAFVAPLNLDDESAEEWRLLSTWSAERHAEYLDAISTSSEMSWSDY